MFLVALKVKKLLEYCMLKNYKNQIRKSLELKKQYIENAINYMLNEKAMIVLLAVALIKETEYK